MLLVGCSIFSSSNVLMKLFREAKNSILVILAFVKNAVQLLYTIVCHQHKGKDKSENSPLFWENFPQKCLDLTSLDATAPFPLFVLKVFEAVPLFSKASTPLLLHQEQHMCCQCAFQFIKLLGWPI